LSAGQIAGCFRNSPPIFPGRAEEISAVGAAVMGRGERTNPQSSEGERSFEGEGKFLQGGRSVRISGIKNNGKIKRWKLVVVTERRSQPATSSLENCTKINNKGN
jgi:hypothetical protein